MGAPWDVVGDIGGAIGGLVGDVAGQGDRDRAAGYLDYARRGYEKLDPRIQAERVNSQFNSVDPGARAAQMDALTRFRSQYGQGGLDAIARSNLNDINTNQGNAARTAQAGVMQDAARRGVASSGNTLVAQQLAGQGAVQQGNQQALGVGALQEAGRRQAMAGAAGVAGEVRGQDYQRAAAQDAIARFNAQNQMGAQQASYQNALNKQGGIAGVYGAQAGQANQQAKATRDRWSNVGDLAGDFASLAA